MIANGANGATGVLAPKLVVLDLNKGLVLLLNKLSILESNVMEKHHKLSNVTIFHVQLIANGATGATGVLAPKLVELDLKKGTVKYHNMLRVEDCSVLDSLMKHISVQVSHVQFLANGAPGVTGALVQQPAALDINKDIVLLLTRL